jgi:tetratricopeptide (TPR) repeat protein
LSSRRFSTWEGGTRFLVHDDYVNAHLLRGTGRLREGRAADALRDFEAALAYPPTLGVARPYRGGRDGEVQYFVGRAHAALGHAAPARAAWRRAAEPTIVTARETEAGVQQFFQARALDELGERQHAQTIYAALVQSGQRRLSPGDGVDFFAKFSEQHVSHTREAQAHYLIGLGQLGLGRADLAREAFERCLRLDVSHVWAAEQLKADPR